MSPQFNSAAITGNATVGGKMKVRGNTTFSRNLKVEGWLDAPNIKGPLKGWFRDVASLETYYRNPQTGWLAIVGTTVPGPLYIAENGRWEPTDMTGGSLTVEASKIVEDVEALQSVAEETVSRVATMENDLTVLSGDDSEYELSVADEDGNVVFGISGGHVKTASFDSSSLREDIVVQEIEVTDENDTDSGDNPQFRFDSDLSIADEKGNVVVSFADGHIRTRLFDSSEVSLNSGGGVTALPMQGKILAVLGDSISTFAGHIPEGYAAYYPKGDVSGVAQTYWHIVAEELGLEIGANCSWSGSYVHGDGSSTTSAAAGCSNRRLSDLSSGGEPDIIIVNIGINDFNDGTPLGDYTADDMWISDGVYPDFSHAYGLMLQKLMKSYPKSRIVVCTLMESAFRDSDGLSPTVRDDGVKLADFNRVIRSLAEGYGLTVADLHSCGIHWANMSYYYLDSSLHPNAAGHRLIASKLLKQLTMNS